MKHPGQFIPYLLRFGQHISADDQAKTILTTARDFIAKGAVGVAITYSANYGQTETINKTYADGGWDTGTSGVNQAEVMMSMEKLLGGTYSDLQKLMRIAPITTMTYSDYGNQTHEQVVDQDLANIRSLMDQGWVVLGWKNQSSDPLYAVGGGVAARPGPNGVIPFPKKLSDSVQDALADIVKEYVPH